MKITIKLITFFCVILSYQQTIIAQKLVKSIELETRYNNAKKQDLIFFDILGEYDYSISKQVNKFLRNHSDLGIASFQSSVICLHGAYKHATKDLKLFFVDKIYSLYPEEYNTLSKINSLKECFIYDFSTKKYKKGRWTGHINQESYAEGYGTGFYDISISMIKAPLKYGGMITGTLENGKPNGFCDVKLTTLENSSFGQKISYFRYSGKFSNGKKDGELLLELNSPISLKSVKNIKYILAKFSNDYGVGTGYLFNSNGDVIGKGVMNKNGQIDLPRLNNDDIKTIIRVVGVVVGAKALLNGGIKAMQYAYKKYGIKWEGTKYSYNSKDNEYFTILSDKRGHDIQAEKMSYTRDNYASIFIKDDGFF